MDHFKKVLSAPGLKIMFLLAFLYWDVEISSPFWKSWSDFDSG